MIHLAPNDAAIVREGSRVWLVTPRVFSPEVRRVLTRQDPMRPRRLRGASDRASLRRLYARMVSMADINRRSDAEVAVWVERALARGSLMAFDITPDARRDPSILDRRQLSALRIPGGLPQGPTLPLPQMEDQSPQVLRERCVEIVHRAPGHMDRDLRREFETLLIPTSLEEAVTTLRVWTGTLEEGVRAAFGPQLFGRAWELSGWGTFEGLDALARCVQLASNALTAAGLEEPARQLALAIEALGAPPFFMITAQVAALERESLPNFEAALRRWAGFLETITLSVGDARAGAMWGSLTPHGEFAAAQLARRQQRVTLAGVLTDAGFVDRFLGEFRAEWDTSLTRRIWDLACRRYVAALTGRVSVYVEGSGAAAVPADQRQTLASLLAPTVTEVEVVDVGVGNATTVFSRAALGA